jgi:uncharacterized cupin superfamily protein
MEAARGIHQSHIQAEEWERDQDPPGEVHVLFAGAEMQAGLWRPVAGVTPDPVSWVLPARESILVLEGRGRIEIEGSATIDLTPGTMASLPKGAETTWHITPDFMEFWVLGKE